MNRKMVKMQGISVYRPVSPSFTSYPNIGVSRMVVLLKLMNQHRHDLNQNVLCQSWIQCCAPETQESMMSCVHPWAVYTVVFSCPENPHSPPVSCPALLVWQPLAVLPVAVAFPGWHIVSIHDQLTALQAGFLCISSVQPLGLLSLGGLILMMLLLEWYSTVWMHHTLLIHPGCFLLFVFQSSHIF